jgi:hypothetical protein
MRIPYAAKVLIDQTTERRPHTNASMVGHPDGFGVIRSIKFNKATSTWLAPLLEAIGDERIEALELDGKGLLTVTFIPGIEADFKHPFPLDAAETVTGS